MKRIKIDIISFWKEILKMAIVPALLILVGLYGTTLIDISNVQNFVIFATIYSVVYMLLFWIFSMNNYERNLFTGIFNKTFKIKKS